MRVLIACEMSGRVREAFASQGKELPTLWLLNGITNIYLTPTLLSWSKKECSICLNFTMLGL